MTDPPIVDDREDAPSLLEEAEELEAAAEKCRERAEALEGLHDLANDAQGALKALEDHDEVGDTLAAQIGLLRRMVATIEHNQQWGYSASYFRQDARRKEADADVKRRLAEAPDGAGEGGE